MFFLPPVLEKPNLLGSWWSIIIIYLLISNLIWIDWLKHWWIELLLETPCWGQCHWWLLCNRMVMIITLLSLPLSSLCIPSSVWIVRISMSMGVNKGSQIIRDFILWFSENFYQIFGHSWIFIWSKEWYRLSNSTSTT